MTTNQPSQYGSTGTYGIDEVAGRFNPARGERKPSHFNIYERATGKDVCKGLTSRSEAEAVIDRMEKPQPETPQQEAPKAAPTGWSKAARARRGEHGHPFGELVKRQGGRSVYRDYATGGRVEIWDNE